MFDLKIMPVEKCGRVGTCQASPSGYASSLKSQYIYTEPSTDRVADHALAQLEAARQVDIATHEKNLPAIENNKLIVTHITQLMEAIGMPRSYRVRDTKSRARYPKYDTLPAGYLADLQREVKTDDGFASATSSYERMLAQYQAFKAQAAQVAEQALRERAAAAEREKQAKLANVELAEIILRYGMDREFDWRDVLDALRDQHQRADLAVAMMRVRHDWNDGPDPVSNAMDRFKIETNEDKEIANSILRNLGDGWDGDGRCFRDCEWNFDRLIASLPEQLGADINTAWRRSSEDA
jgi:hypothetical protein